jgi:hypothetical protein
VRYDDLLLELMEADLVKGGLDAVDYDGEVLSPLEVGLRLGGVREVDE